MKRTSIQVSLLLATFLSTLSACVESETFQPPERVTETAAYSLTVAASVPPQAFVFQVEYDIKGCVDPTSYRSTARVQDNEALHQDEVTEGCYNIDITPYVDSGYTKSSLCEVVSLTNVQIVKDTTLEVNLPCEDPVLDPLDQKLQDNDPPTFTQIFFNPSSIVSCHWHTEVCVAAFDKDELVMDWVQVSGANTEIVVTKQTRFPDVLFECAEFYPSGEGDLVFDVTAFDQFTYQGKLEVLEVLAWERGLQVLSRDTKRFKLNAFCY